MKLGRLINTLRGHQEGIYCSAFDGMLAVTGAADGVIMIWDMVLGGSHEVVAHDAEVYCIGLNARAIASGSADSTVRVWDRDGSCQHVLRGHVGIVRCLRLGARRLVTGGDNRQVMVWDYIAGILLHQVHRHPFLVHLMEIDEKRIVTASPDSPGTVSIITYG